MKKILFPLFILLCVTQLHSQDKSFVTNLPIVYINTHGKEIIDEPKILASMEITWDENGGENSTSSPRNHFKGDVGIEIRGSSSQMFPKKSYGFELRDEAGEDMNFPILGMPKEEDWILYAPYTDKTLIRNVLTFTLAAQISDAYVPRCKYVELFINGKYNGIYVLMEKIKRDKNRVNISKLKEEDTEGEDLTGGYIIKIDKLTGSGGDGWYSNYTNSKDKKTYYQYEYPKDSKIQPEQKEYIQNYFHDFETAVHNLQYDSNSNYLRYINQQSFFDYIIMSELTKNIDGYRLSTFLHKDKSGKLNAGPLWDYNLAYGNANYYGGWLRNNLFVHTDIGNDNAQIPFWWKKLMLDDKFVNLLKCRWKELRNSTLSNVTITNVIDSLVAVTNGAMQRNYQRWPIIGTQIWPNYYVGKSYESEVSWMKKWIEDRTVNLDGLFSITCDETGLPVKPSPKFSVKLFPSPFNSHLRIYVESKYTLTRKLELYNVSGQKKEEILLQLTEGKNSFSINTTHLPEGVYFYKVLDEYGNTLTGKILKI